eukprot:Phypoly_transcript_17184.p1 GENE.Phypoly_transcript_17184~~Phypoly_transcript_17184.p1  ORF type:complete len:213 (+),score=67.94 Phypoly_transcript_17184:120-758(+)
MAAAAPPAPGSEGQLLAAGLYQLLSPVVEECDARIQEVMDSQAHLSQQIETLAADLDYFMTFTQTPPLAAHLQRLLNSRNRLVTINTTLLTIMNRLDKISASVDPQAKERKLSLGLFSKKKESQPTLQPQSLIQPPSPQVTQPTQPSQPIQPTQPLQTQQPTEPTQPSVQQQTPQEIPKNDTLSVDKENGEQTNTEPLKEEVSNPTQEVEQK